MLALPAHGFVLLSLPKCASTSMVKAVAGQAEMVLRINPKLKHINCAQFHELMVPVLRKGGYQRKDYEVVSLFREPVEWLEVVVALPEAACAARGELPALHR